MGTLIRTFDWSKTPLGPLDAWPQSLKQTVELMLAMPQAACIGWGPDARLLYNDEYAALLNAKHPDALGRPFAAVWPELTEVLRPVIDAVLAGRPQRFVDQELALEGRGEGLGASWRTAAWTPLRDGAGYIAGFLSVGLETTGRVLAERQREQAEARLRASKQRLQRVLETDAVGVIFFDQTGTVIDANHVFSEMTGYTRADIDSRELTWRRMTPPEWVRKSEEQMAKLAATGRIGPYEKEYFCKNGSRRWMLFAGRDLGDGTVAEYCIDIADRKRAEERLRRNHETFYRLIQNHPFGVYVIDADFCLREVSRGSRKVFANVRPLIGRDFAEVLRTIWPEPFASEAIGRFRHTLETGEPYVSPSTVERRRDIDEVEAYDWRIERITLPDGRFGVVCYFYDWSERQEWEAALRESEERFRQFSDASSDVLWTRDAETLQWELLSSGFEAVYGKRREEALHGDTMNNWAEMIVPEDRDRALDAIGRVRAGEEVTFEYRIRRPDGEQRWLRDADFPLRDHTGRIRRIGGVGRDITDQKRAEEHTHFMMREMAHRSKNLLAVVQAMVRQTARNSLSMEEFQDRLADRIAALSDAHDILLARDWRGAPLRDVIMGQLEPFVGAERERVTLEGPDLMVSAAAAQSLALTVHELSTNASKHGALSAPGGSVSIHWELEEHEGRRRFSLRWTERGGPPVPAPERRGFGSFVLERMVGAGLNGESRVDFPPAGVTWTLTCDRPSFLV